MHSTTEILNAPGTICTQQIRHSLTWLNAFFHEELPGVVRHFEVLEDLGTGAQLGLGTDASPYGIGGLLAMNGVIPHYFAAA